jgi:hypothetical protein
LASHPGNPVIRASSRVRHADVSRGDINFQDHLILAILQQVARYENINMRQKPRGYPVNALERAIDALRCACHED